MQVPFVIYADFESILKPYQAAAGDKSEIKSKHQACGFIRLSDMMVHHPMLEFTEAKMLGISS